MNLGCLGDGNLYGESELPRAADQNSYTLMISEPPTLLITELGNVMEPMLIFSIAISFPSQDFLRRKRDVINN